MWTGCLRSVQWENLRLNCIAYVWAHSDVWGALEIALLCSGRSSCPVQMAHVPPHTWSLVAPPTFTLAWKWCVEAVWGFLGCTDYISAFRNGTQGSAGQTLYTDTQSWCLQFASSLHITVSQFHVEWVQVKEKKYLPGCKPHTQNSAGLSLPGGASLGTKTQQFRPGFLWYPLPSVSLTGVSGRFITLQW